MKWAFVSEYGEVFEVILSEENLFIILVWNLLYSDFALVST